MTMKEQGNKKIQEQENKAYFTLKGQIVKGIFPPGYRLVERELADQLGMSRTPIRWAIKRLEAEGFLERKPSRGVCLKILDFNEVLELLYIRESLEGMAGRLAAENRTPEQAQAIMAVVEEMEKELCDHELLNYYRLSGELHQLIMAASHNNSLIKMATHVNSQAARFQYKNLLLAGRVSESVKEHRAIAEAICAANPDEAEQRIRQHIRVIRELVQKVSTKPDYLAF